LGLITEPLLTEFHLTREGFAQMNLWATLIGSLACLPAGTWLDRRGPRGLTILLLSSLAVVVWTLSAYHAPSAESVSLRLFILILLTRALGQSALSVLSIGVASSAFHKEQSRPAAIYAVLLSILFMVSFGVLGATIRGSGWRTAWEGISLFLMMLTPLAFLLQKRLIRSPTAHPQSGLTLNQCIRQPVFWVYCSGICLFAGVQAGIGLFNEALLGERGFDRETYHHFIAGTAIIALLGQALGGGSRWLPLRGWLGFALVAQGIGLAGFKFISNQGQLWLFASIMGITGGIITVAFFAIWPESFGRRHLGRIMGAVQTLSVLSSSAGPLLLERGATLYGSFSQCLSAAAPLSILIGLFSFFLKPASDHD